METGPEAGVAVVYRHVLTALTVSLHDKLMSLTSRPTETNISCKSATDFRIYSESSVHTDTRQMMQP